MRAWLWNDGLTNCLSFAAQTITTRKLLVKKKNYLSRKILVLTQCRTHSEDEFANSWVYACERGVEAEFNLLRLSNETISNADSIGSARQFASFFNGKPLPMWAGRRDLETRERSEQPVKIGFGRDGVDRLSRRGCSRRANRNLRYRGTRDQHGRPLDLSVWLYNQCAGAENLIKEANDDVSLAAHLSNRWMMNANWFQIVMLPTSDGVTHVVRCDA